MSWGLSFPGKYTLSGEKRERGRGVTGIDSSRGENLVLDKPVPGALGRAIKDHPRNGVGVGGGGAWEGGGAAPVLKKEGAKKKPAR